MASEIRPPANGINRLVRLAVSAVLLQVLLVPSTDAAMPREGIDCGCTTTDSYRAPARGREIRSHTLSLTDGVSSEKNPLYTASATTTQVTVTRVSDGVTLLTDTFRGDAAWGFSPDEHRFVRHSFDGAFFNVTLYDLQSSTPATPRWSYEATVNRMLAMGDTHLSFSPRGNHLLFVTLTGSNQLQLRLVDVTSGEILADAITFTAASGLEDRRYGAATWGFSRDADDGSFVYAYMTAGGRVKWRLINLAAGMVVSDEDPASLIASFWRFSPCGDTVGMVQQTAADKMMIRLLRTFDGETLYTGMNFPVETVLFRSESEAHWAQVHLTDVFLAPNTAYLDCLPEPDTQPPTWPTGATLTFTDITYDSITVNWPAAVDNVGVTAYRVSRGSILVTLPASARTHTFSGLTAGTGYSFSVRAVDAAGNRSAALTGNASTPQIVPPSWPEDARLMARYPWGSRLDLYWRPAEHPDEISQYRIYQDGEEIITFAANPAATNIRRQVSGLVEGESYTFKVEAQNAHGFWSDDGPDVTILFDLDSPPSWPAGSELIAEQTTTDTVTLRWTPATHPISVGEYRIYVNGQRDQSVWAAFEADPVPTTATVTGLCPVTTYHFQVEAVDDNYQQSAGGPETLAITEPDITPPTWPEESFVTACELGTTRITLYWTPAEDDVEVTGYRIYRNDALVGALEIPPKRCGVDIPGNGDETPSSMELAGMEHALTTWTVENMVPGQSYTFRIEAGDLAGNWSDDGPEVTQATLLTPPDTTIPLRDDYALFQVFIPNSEGTYARGLNDAGQVTVNAFVPSSRAFFWDNGLAINLGDLGRGRATAFAIDPHGRITGESPISTTKTVGFIWDERGMRSLGYYSMSHWDMPRAINAHGDIVGTSRYVPIGSGRWIRAILWRRVETEQADGSISVSYPILNLGTLGGDAFMSAWETVDSEAMDINNARQIVGTAPAPHPETGSWTRRAFLWEDGVMTNLGTLGGSRQYGTSSQAWAINQAGQVIGTALTASGQYRGFFWSGGVMTSLGALGGDHSTPNALNDHGVVVGTADTNRRDCRGQVIRRAFRWQGGTVLDLGSLGGPSSVASAINNTGLIVGYADAFDGRSLPFLWENGMIYLVGDETWHSGHAHSINALGQILINASVIVGYRERDPWGPHANETGDNGSSDQVPIIENRVYLATPWDIAPPVWPEGAELRVTTIGTTRISLAWDSAEHRDGISGYRLYQDGAFIADVSAEDRAHTISGLSPDTEHLFKVEAGAPNGQWSGMGPSTVATTTVAGQEDHTLTYLHGTGGALVGATSQTVPDGGTGSEVEARPDAGAVFHQWSDGRTDNPRLDSDVQSDITVTAFFRSEGGADIDWYAEHGYAPDEGEDWADLDNREVEGKGTTLREENIADTDPTDPHSVFSVVSIEPGPPPAVIVQPFSSRRVYTLQSRASLTEGEWRDVPGQVDVPGGEVPLTDPEAEGTVYYRVLVGIP